MNILREIGGEYKKAGNLMLAEVREQLRGLGIVNCRHDRKRGLLMVWSGPAAGERLLFEISASVRTGRIVIRYLEGEAGEERRVRVCRIRYKRKCGRELAGAMRMLMAMDWPPVSEK